jgi:hypothetical protein
MGTERFAKEAQVEFQFRIPAETDFDLGAALQLMNAPRSFPLSYSSAPAPLSLLRRSLV